MGRARLFPQVLTQPNPRLLPAALRAAAEPHAVGRAAHSRSRTKSAGNLVGRTDLDRRARRAHSESIRVQNGLAPALHSRERAPGMWAASRPIEGNDVLMLLIARGEKRHERHHEVPCEARSWHRAPRGRPCSPRRGVERIERLRAAGAGDRLLRVPSSRSCMGVTLQVHGEWRPHRGPPVVSTSSASVRPFGTGGVTRR